MKLHFSKASRLTFAILLLGTAPMFSQTSPGGNKKQENLASDSAQEKIRRIVDKALEDEETIKELFAVGDEAVPLLVKSLSDPDKGRRIRAARGLAYIGNQEGMQALRIAAKAEKDSETKPAISCFLAGRLVEIKSEADLQLLKSWVERARFGRDKEEVPSFCAAIVLGMMGGSDSLAILRKAVKAGLNDSDEITEAIQWMENKSSQVQVAAEQPISDEELIKKTVLERTFFALGKTDESSVAEITFDPGRNKALVSVDIYQSAKKARGYELVLARETSIWRVAGIWFAWAA